MQVRVERKYMARKSATSRRIDVENSKYDDSKYGEVLFSVTYEVNEYSIDQAAGFLGGETPKKISLGISALGLLGLILVLMYDSNSLPLAFVMLGVSVAASAASTNWHKIQTWFARRSNLGIRGEKDDRRHVVVTNDFVAIEGPEGYEAKLPFSDLRRVDADDSICLAYFGHGSYAYFPRPAMSENRFHNLVVFLRAKRSK